MSSEDQEDVGWSSINYLKGNTSIPFDEEDSPNGIAYDATGNRLFITGKLWPKVYEIRLVASDKSRVTT
jgi:glutaminyl-peptide cyclotransferase